MGSPAKALAILFVSSFAFVKGNESLEPRKIEIGNTVPLAVSSPARVAIPIQFQSQDYSGPYDPADPKGIAAATRRRMKMQNQKVSEVVKSYVPPDIDKVAQKEFINLAKSEGKRFAFSHPKETAELIGIGMKVKHLVNDAAKKVTDAEKKNKN